MPRARRSRQEMRPRRSRCSRATIAPIRMAASGSKPKCCGSTRSRRADKKVRRGDGRSGSFGAIQTASLPHAYADSWMSERVMSRAGLGTARLAFLAALSCVVACGTTVDSLGSGETERPGNDVPASVMLGPLRGPTTYPNPLRDLLALERGDIDAKIEETFRRLFEGDPVMERIYLGVGEDQGFVLDVLHSDVRTEGMGYAMMITVQLDKRDYFDRLWSYAKQALPYREGANEG